MAAVSKGRLTQTYISKLENGGIDVPTRGMMEALADVLGVPLEDLYREAGVLEGVGNGGGGETAPALTIEGDRPFDPAQIVAYVENKPDPRFQAQLARAKARRTPERYERLCLRIYRAWSSNADLVMDELAAIEME